MMARLMLSAGMLTPFAASTAVRRRGFASGSPPLRAAIMISLMMRVNVFPRLASRAAFLCLMVAHLECPDMDEPQREQELNLFTQNSMQHGAQARRATRAAEQC